MDMEIEHYNYGGSFILTIRNVKSEAVKLLEKLLDAFYLNYKECEVDVGKWERIILTRFILTIRNVKHYQIKSYVKHIIRFILTIRNVKLYFILLCLHK